MSLPSPLGNSASAAFCQLRSQRGDLRVEHGEHGSEDFEPRAQPCGQELLQGGPALRTPPARRRGPIVIDEQTAALGLEYGALSHEGFALPVVAPDLLPLLGRDAYDRKFVGVSLDVSREPLAEHAGVERVGLHAVARLLELARGDDVTRRPERMQPPGEAESKPARLHRRQRHGGPRQQILHPRLEFRGPQPPRGFGRGVSFLQDDHEPFLPNIHSALDRRG